LVRRSFAIFLSLILIVVIPNSVSAANVNRQLVVGVGNPWEGSLVTYPSVFHNSSKFMMWYTGEDVKGYDQIGLAMSIDGVNWSKYDGNPVLKLGPSGSWDSGSVIGCSVIFDNGIFKMWYGGQTYQYRSAVNSWQIGYATSPDGIHWTKYAGNPVLTNGTIDSWDGARIINPVVLHEKTGYIMYYAGVAWKNGNIDTNSVNVGLALSDDGIQWTKHGELSLPVSGWYARMPRGFGSVVNINGTYVATFSGAPALPSREAKVGLATSSDGMSWSEVSGNPVLAPSSSGWDSGYIYGSAFVPLNGKYFLYYIGWSSTTGSTQIGLAQLPMSQYHIP
jgi:predicted GH43/DUF377 family glycosyl hydrolase